MPIVCGTDLSPAAEPIAVLAVRLAARLATRLVLVHVVEDTRADDEALADDAHRGVRERLAALAGRLRAAGAPVETRLHAGTAGFVVPSVANSLRARLVVVGNDSRATAFLRLVGGTAIQTVAESRCPVLVVRRPAELEAWAAGGATLTILLALAHDDATAPLVGLLRQLRQVATCDIRALRVARPADVHARLGLREAPASALHPEAQAVVRRELDEALAGLPGQGALRSEVVASEERVDALLVRLADEAHTGLVMLGAGHAGAWSGGHWGGGVARRVLQATTTNALLVPPLRADPSPLPVVKAVLVPVAPDHGDAAVAWACAMVAPGGTVHLLEVVEPTTVRGFIRQVTASDPEGRPADLPEVHARLRAVVPDEASRRAVAVRTHVCWGRDAAGVAAAVAERLGVDLLCLDGGTARVAPPFRPAALIERTGRPVLVVKMP